jgi:putative transposase
LKFEKEFDCEYDPAKNAVLTLEDLHELIHIFIIDIVCQEPHPKFGTPKAEAWRKAIDEFPPVLPSSRRDLRILLGTVVERVISRNGIEFEGLYYRSEELTLLRQIYEQRDRRRTGGIRDREKAKIKIDPTDISCVYVYNPTTLEFVRIPAVAQSYTKDLSLWQHKKIKELAAREAEKVDLTALILAKAKIQEVVDRAWRNVKGGRSRSTAARWLGIGRGGIDVGEVENYHKQQLSERQANSSSTDFAPTVDCEVNGAFDEDASVGESISVENISNFESAFDENFFTEIVNSELDSFISPDSLDARNQLTQNSLQEEQLENSTVIQQNPTELLKPSSKRKKQGSDSTATEKKTSGKKPQSKKSSTASNSQNKQKHGEKQEVEDEPKQNSVVTKLI